MYCIFRYGTYSQQLHVSQSQLLTIFKYELYELCLERETSKLQEKLPSYRRETSKLRSIYSCCIVLNACSAFFGELHAFIEFSSTTKDHEVPETHLAEKMRENWAPAHLYLLGPLLGSNGAMYQLSWHERRSRNGIRDDM